MSEPIYIILHGLDGSPEGHWQDWLARALREQGCEVRFSCYPEANNPNFTYWLSLLHLDMQLYGNRRKVVIAHSLGALLWAYYAAFPKAVNVDRLLLVAPPSEVLIRQCGRVRDFPEHVLGGLGRALNKAGEAVLVTSPDDPWFLGGAQQLWMHPKLQTKVLAPGARHINIESGYGAWAFALSWALQENELLHYKPLNEKPENLLKTCENYTSFVDFKDIKIL